MLSQTGGAVAPPGPIINEKLINLLSKNSLQIFQQIKNPNCTIPDNKFVDKLENELYDIRNNFLAEGEIQFIISQAFFDIRKRTNKVSSYDVTAFPPFLVVISSSRELHPMNIGKFLFENNVEGILQVESKGRRRIGVNFKTPMYAYNFIEKGPRREGWKIFIPERMITSKAIVRNVGEEIFEEDFVKYGKGIRGPVRTDIINAKRMYRRVKSDNETRYEPTNTFVIMFKGNLIPMEVDLYNTIHKVQAYKNPVIMCLKCYRFGHSQRYCRSLPRCIRCHQSHEEEIPCEKDVAKVICINCSGDHPPSSKECLEYKRQVRINEIMANQNISFYEAYKLMPKNNEVENSNSHFPNTLRATIQTRTPRFEKQHSYVSVLKRKKTRSPSPETVNRKQIKECLFPDSSRMVSSPIQSNYSQMSVQSKSEMELESIIANSQGVPEGGMSNQNNITDTRTNIKNQIARKIIVKQSVGNSSKSTM